MTHIRKNVARMTGYTPGEQPQSGPVLKLNTNENPYPPSPHVRQALEQLPIEQLARYPDPLCSELKQTLARLHACLPEQLLIGNGSDEALALCLRAFVERDGTVGYFDPSYSLYPVLAQIEDLQTRPLPLSPDFQWAMPPHYHTSLFFLTRPNAPTGIAYPLDTVRDFCAQFQGIVLIDEAYAAFAEDHCRPLVDTFDNVLVARTLSKSHALAGLRLGYLIGPPPLIAALHKIKDSYNIGTLPQLLASAALQDEDYYRETTRRIIHTRQTTAERLHRLGFHLTPSQANFLWTRPPAHLSAANLFLALKKQHIYVRHFNAPRTNDYLRISIGTDDQMDRLLDTLAHLLEKHHATNS